MTLTALLNRPFDRAAERAVRRTRSLVEIGPEAERSLYRRDMTRMVVGLLALACGFFVPEPLGMMIGGPILGFIVGGSGLKSKQEANAYRSGWIQGRRRIYEQAIRHRHCSHDASVYLETEAAHDALNVAGVEIDIRFVEDEDGSEGGKP